MPEANSQLEQTKAAQEICQDPDYIAISEVFAKLPVNELFVFKTPPQIEVKISEIVKNPVKLRRMVTQLRKNQQAYAARTLLQALPNAEAQNLYSIRESGWTLIACIKQTESHRRESIERASQAKAKGSNRVMKDSR